MDRYQDLLGISNVYFPKKNFKFQRQDLNSRRVTETNKIQLQQNDINFDEIPTRESIIEEGRANKQELTKKKRLNDFYKNEIKEILESARKSTF